MCSSFVPVRFTVIAYYLAHNRTLNSISSSVRLVVEILIVFTFFLPKLNGTGTFCIISHQKKESSKLQLILARLGCGV